MGKNSGEYLRQEYSENKYDENNYQNEQGDGQYAVVEPFPEMGFKQQGS